MSTQKRKPAPSSNEKPVKTTISLDVDLYSRLCAKAARRRVGISALAVEYIRAGLRGMVVIDRSESSDRGTGSDRLRGGSEISPNAEEEAA